MIIQIDFLDVFSAKALQPSADLAVISVLGAKEEEHRPSFDGFDESQLLRMRFDDIVYVMSEEHRIDGPTQARAQQIHDFIAGLHRSERPLRLVAHCFGGVSRSAAIALHAASLTGLVPMQVQARAGAASVANERLRGMLVQAARPGVTVELPRPDFGHADSFIPAHRSI